MTDSDLEKMFAAYGTVESAQVVMDRDTGRSKGFGFVEMKSDQEAQAAIAGLNGQELRRPHPDRQRGPAARPRAAAVAAAAAAAAARRRRRRWGRPALLRRRPRPFRPEAPGGPAPSRPGPFLSFQEEAACRSGCACTTGSRSAPHCALKKLLERSGLKNELRRRKYYEKPCELRRRAKLRKLSAIRKSNESPRQN